VMKKYRSVKKNTPQPRHGATTTTVCDIMASERTRTAEAAVRAACSTVQEGTCDTH
jgi:hypothetical protein